MIEFINKQPVLNIGMLGSVSDGKSTAVLKLSGIKTQKHSDELKKNITIKPGYANLKIYQDENNNFTNKKDNNKLVHHLSFIDCPGHQQLILTMLGNINLMNGVIIVVSMAEDLSKKTQLIQHLAAVKIAKIKKIIICLNKIDLVPKKKVLERKQELEKLLNIHNIKPNIFIPTSFSKNLGINYLLQAIYNLFSPDDIKPNLNIDPLFKVSRSFDVNKNGISWEKITGGVLGGSLISGKLNVGDEIEIRPGIKVKEANKVYYKPIITKIESIQTETDTLDNIIPGGLMGIKTDIDPFYCKKDFMAGSIIGLKNKVPNIYSEIKLELNLTDDFGGYWKPALNDNIDLQIGTLLIEGTVININPLKIKLKKDACIEDNALIIISRRLKIVGYGKIKK